jgi:gamma-glutamyltranspeptidase / glutathione hydrolase
MHQGTGTPGQTIMSVHGMVASAHPLASRAGAAILERGGNAFDAAVSVAAALNVVEPFMSGLAGMGFATMWVASESRVRVLDFVPPVPASFPASRFSRRSELARGAPSVGLPGNLAGWHQLSCTYGTLPFAVLLQSAIRLADSGYAIMEYGSWEISHQAKDLSARPDIGSGWKTNYPFSAGASLGQIVRQPELAATLRIIASEGIECFYGGRLGEQVVDYLASLGGFLTRDDLAVVTVSWREPLRASYRGLDIHVPPPPCEGFQFLLTLRILEGFDLAGLEPDGAAHLDLVIRAIRLAAGVRIAHNQLSEAEVVRLLAEPFVEDLRAQLRAGEGEAGQTEQWTADPFENKDPAHTTSFSVADREGNLVCVTQSLGSAFGSGVVVPGTGICLNNFLYWADVQPGSPNRSKPGSVLPMCMSPSISTKAGKPALALGTPGGYGILQTQAQAMVQMLDFGLPLQAAISAPRMRVWDGREIEIENRIDAATIAAVRQRGHDIRAFPTGWTMLVGGMQAIRRDPDTGLLTGAADPRRDGAVAPL